VIILFFVLIGVFSGWVANIILGGGSRPANWGRLFGAGLIGSFVGGMLGSLIFDGDLKIRPSGLIGSIIGAVIVLAILNAIEGRNAADQ
jgi:uncharacterized membrane protein YeaQ/YmgE (transglycosylase-associated protein family)